MYYPPIVIGSVGRAAARQASVPVERHLDLIEHQEVEIARRRRNTEELAVTSAGFSQWFSHLAQAPDPSDAMYRAQDPPDAPNPTCESGAADAAGLHRESSPVSVAVDTTRSSSRSGSSKLPREVIEAAATILVSQCRQSAHSSGGASSTVAVPRDSSQSESVGPSLQGSSLGPLK